jgi:Transcriptional regulators containing a DNA-binding HTH domain and an aminotransferase domain (MocR family) and their eukaryotic orthologs
MDIVLPENDNRPLYSQLYTVLKEAIECGDLSDGVKLPSVRMLQSQLSISKTPIETACQMLVEEGYLISRPRSGLFVTCPVQLASKGKLEAGISHSLSSEQSNCIDFNLLTVDAESIPVRDWRAALNETLLTSSHLLHQYGDVQGELGLRTSLAQYLNVSRGVRCNPEQIIVGTGIASSIRLLAYLLEKFCPVAFLEGGIAQVRGYFTNHGFKIVDIPLTDNSSEPDNWIKALYLTPSHHPSGAPLSYPMRMKLLNWASTNQAYIIEDDYDGEFRHSGRTIPAMKGLDQQDRVIYMGTFSKVFSPSLRMNYLILPSHLLPMLQSAEYLLSPPSRIDQLAMQKYMDQGKLYRQIRRMRKLYKEKRERLVQLIKQHLEPFVCIIQEGAGLHLELLIPHASCHSEELRRLAEHAGVRVYLSQQREGTLPKVFLGYGGINGRDMERGILLLKRAWGSVFTSPVQ